MFFHTDVNLKIEDISSIGIGTPGAVDSAKGIVVFANNLGFKNVELGKMLEEKLGKKVYCENDANVAAYGEYLVDDENEGDTLVAITRLFFMICVNTENGIKYRMVIGLVSRKAAYCP